MSFFPDAKTFISIGSLSVKWYAICFLGGALLTYFLMVKDFKKNGYKKELVDDLFIGCLFTGLIFARLWFCIGWDPAYYFSNPLRLLQIWEGGIGIQGGLIGGTLYGYYFTKKHNMSFFRAADCVLPNILIAQVAGRWGNFINQEAYGKVVTEAFYQYYPSFIKNQMYIDGAYRQPTFLWESVLNLIGFIVIRYGLKKFAKPKRGDLSWAYLVWYGVVRFVIEGYRTDNLMLFGFKASQMMGLLFALVGVIGFIVMRKTYHIKKPVVLFDLDGTLLDTEAGILETYRYLFAKYDKEENFDSAKQKEVLGPSLESMFKKYFPMMDTEKLVEEYRAYNFSIHPTHVKKMKNTEEILKFLKDNSYKVGIVSTKRREAIELGLNQFELMPYIDVIVGQDEVKEGKPNPEGILKACEKIKENHDSCVYVGDSHTDIQAGHNAGVYTVGYIFREDKKEDILSSKPNTTITDLIKLETILKEDHTWTYNMM